MSIELFKVEKRSKTSLGFEFLKLTANPKVLENLKRSWKKSWEFIESEELERVRTLPYEPCHDYSHDCLLNSRFRRLFLFLL